MTTFAFHGFDRSGRGAEGLTDAPDAKSAREQLAKRGILADRVEPAGMDATGGRRAAGRSSLSTTSGRAIFYEELSALLRAGIPLVQGLGLLLEAPEQRTAGRALAAIRDRIREGAGLSSALSASIPGLLAYEAPILEAGERSATLDDTLESLAKFLDEQTRLREQAISAMIYPAFILALALAIAVGALGFAFPRIVAILQEGHVATMPAITRMVFAAGRVLGILFPTVLLAFGAAMLWQRSKKRSNVEFALKWDKKLFAIPVLGSSRSLLAGTRFCRTLALLIRAGVPIVEALPAAGRATGSIWLAAETLKAAGEVEHGGTLANALRKIPPLADGIGSWVEVGEAAASLEKVLEQAGKRLQRAWARKSERLLSLLGPTLILAVGAIVFVIVLAVLLPILAINAMPR